MKPRKLSMRILHRYLGFFLAGIMTVYALSGVILIFRDTDFLKRKTTTIEQLKPGLKGEQLGKALHMRKFRLEKEEGNTLYFRGGKYDVQTGKATTTREELPYIVEKMTHLHKASTGDPLYWLNVFFGFSLLFFVLSAFWMYMPKTTVFKKGMIYTAGGIALTLLLLLI